jgi:hypothetical protein
MQKYNPQKKKKKKKKPKKINNKNKNIKPSKKIIQKKKKKKKKNQNPSTYYNSLINFKFQHKPKYHLKKNPHIKIDLLLLLLLPSRGL